MPITPAQLERRRNYLGSSDMAAVMGLDPWRGPKDVYLEKVYGMTPFKGNASTDVGTVLEPGLLNWTEELLGPLRRNQFRVVQGTPIGTHIDAIVIALIEPVEAKTNSVAVPIHKRHAEDWGTVGTDQVPERVIIQCHTHMMALGAARCHVPTVVDGRGLGMFVVPFNRAIAQAISETAQNFWGSFVKLKIPPPGQPAAWETIRRVIRPQGKAVDFDTDQAILAVQWQAAKAAAKIAKKLADDKRNEMLMEMDDAMRANLPDGSFVLVSQTKHKTTITLKGKEDERRTRNHRN